MFKLKSNNIFSIHFLFVIIITFIINGSGNSINLVIAQEDIHFTYVGLTGPEYWHTLPNSSLCRTGKTQSPINIIDSDIQVFASPPEDIIVANASNVLIENNGHTVEIIPNAAQNQIDLPFSFKLNGTLYNLKQFHFHTPSENRINGKYFDLEAHFVLKTPDNSSASVVAVLYNIGDTENAFLIPIVANVPSVADGKLPLTEVALPTVIQSIVNITQAFSYSGSLTTPPCSEGIIWWINTPIQTLNFDQFNKLRQVMGFNSRYTQLRSSEVKDKPLCST